MPCSRTAYLCRACVRIPWDPHLEAGAEANLGQLRQETQAAFLEVAANIATGFAEMEPETPSNLPQLAKPFTEAELAKELERITPRIRGGARVLKFQSGVGSKN